MTTNTDSAGRAYWVSKEGESLPGGVAPRSTGPVEGRHEYLRRAFNRIAAARGICSVRVKYGDHGVRLPRVAGREGGCGRRLATPRQEAAVHCDAKEPLAKAHIASSTRYRSG